jgi:hypothetical protein
MGSHHAIFEAENYFVGKVVKTVRSDLKTTRERDEAT